MNQCITNPRQTCGYRMPVIRLPDLHFASASGSHQRSADRADLDGVSTPPHPGSTVSRTCRLPGPQTAFARGPVHSDRARRAGLVCSPTPPYRTCAVCAPLYHRAVGSPSGRGAAVGSALLRQRTALASSGAPAPAPAPALRCHRAAADPLAYMATQPAHPPSHLVAELSPKQVAGRWRRR